MVHYQHLHVSNSIIFISYHHIIVILILILIKLLAADKNCHIYNTNTGDLINNLEGHSIGLNDCCFIDNNIIATASDDKTVKVWDIETGKVIQTLIGHK